MIWVQLNADSKLVLPNFSQLIVMKENKEDGKVILDLTEFKNVLDKHLKDIGKVEIYRNNVSVKIENKPENAKLYDL